MPFYGECDKILREKYFPGIGMKGIMLEVGAGHPDSYSLSKHFRESGWRCICVEPIPHFVESHKKKGNEIYQYACGSENIHSASFEVTKEADGMAYSGFEMKQSYYANRNGGKPPSQVIQVEIKTLNTLLSEIMVDHLDLLCVDVEGWELDVMRGFDAGKYNPKVIVLENLRSEAVYGAYMDSIGFKLDMREHPNDIYIRK